MMYDAFISYRHAPLDMEMAKKIHTGLETYHIPRSVRTKTGKNKMGRVFRDQEELPIGSDLDDNISGALATSGYLIVICSPRTPESYWVCKEIETFISMHGRNRILAVLIEGEPDESFPKQLLFDDNGAPVEPLAADIRGENKKERNKKFRTEILRLAAPIIGCTYDDLKQRHRERIIKRAVISISTAAALLAAAGIAFGIYNSNVAAKMKLLAEEKAALAEEKTRLADEILEEYRQKQENQSRFYAEKSLALLARGNREDAVLVACEGLPGDEERPFVPEVEDALGQALYAYADGMHIGFDRILKSELDVISVKRNEDKTKLIVIDSGYTVYVYDTESWELLTAVRAEVGEFGYLEGISAADADDTGVYIGTDREFIKYDYNGEVIYRNPDVSYVYNLELALSERCVYMVSSDTVYAADADSGRIIFSYVNDTEQAFFAKKCIYNRETGTYVCAHNALDAESTYLSFIKKGIEEPVRVPLSEGNVLGMCVTPSGNIAALSCNGDFITSGSVERVMLDVADRDGHVLWSREVEADVRYAATFDSFIKAHDYETEEGRCEEIVIAIEYEAFAYDANSGERLSVLTLGGESTSLSLGMGSPLGYVSYTDGDIDIIDFGKGMIYTDSTVKTGLSVMDAVFAGSQIAIRAFASPDVYIMSYHKAPDLEELDTFATRAVSDGTSPDSDYYVIKPLGDFSTYEFYDNEGRHIHTYKGDMSYYVCTGFYDDSYMIAYKDGIVFIDPVNGSEENVSWNELGVSEHISRGLIPDGGSCSVFWDSHYVAVVDNEKKTTVFETKTDEIIGNAVVSDDGTRLYISTSEGGVTAYDTGSGETESYEDKNLRNVSDLSNKNYMTLSHDGRKLAICCYDGMLRIVDTGSAKVCAQSPLTAKSGLFLGFTDDDTHLVVQGDDLKIRIWDMEQNEYVNLTDALTGVNRIICDEETGIMAVLDGLGVYLFETDGYGLKANIEDGLTYLKSNDSVILCYDGRYMYRTFYKDYKALLEEAQTQFPGVSLDDQDKVKYNIE